MTRHITKILAVTLLCHTAMARPVVGWLRPDLENMKPEEKVVYLERQIRGSTSKEVGKIIKSVFEGPVEYPSKITLTVKTRSHGKPEDDSVVFNGLKWFEEFEINTYDLTLRLEWTEGQPMFSQASTRPRDQMDFSWHSWAYKTKSSSGYCKLFSLYSICSDEECTKKLQNLAREHLKEASVSKQSSLSGYIGFEEVGKITKRLERDATKWRTDEYEIPDEFKEFLRTVVPGLPLGKCGDEFFTEDVRKEAFTYSELCKAIKVIESSVELQQKLGILKKQRSKKRQEARLQRKRNRERQNELEKTLQKETAAEKAAKREQARKSLDERQEFEAYMKRRRIPARLVRGMRGRSAKPVNLTGDQEIPTL